MTAKAAVTATPATPAVAPPASRTRSGSKLNQADAAFRQADEAQRSGNTVKWATLVDKGQVLVEEAVALSRQLPADPSAAPSDSPSTDPSETASPSASPSS